jgi:TRAP-type C4-dicarboxylate transport system permease small subunit
MVEAWSARQSARVSYEAKGRKAMEPGKLVRVILVDLPRFIISAAILLSIAINFANIVGRYIFLAPVIWAEEVMVFIMVWCVFIGAIVVSWEGRHIKMDMMSARFGSPLKEVVNGCATVGFIVCAAYVGYQSWTVTSMMARLEQTSVVAEIPMYLPHLAVFLGFVAMALSLVARFRFHVRGDFGSDQEETIKQVTDAYGTFEVPDTATTPPAKF